MGTEPIEGDALGAALLAQLEEGGDAGRHIVERDDGCVSSDSATLYFLDPADWFAVEASVLSRASGRVLDIGAGAGRFAIELQNRGHDVVALDVDAGCLEVCSRVGVHNTFLGDVLDLADTEPEPFDTFLLMGHNIGLLGGPEHAPRLLGALRDMARPGARVIGSGREFAETSDPLNLSYHQLNRERGRPPGQLRLRVRWGNLASPWFDYWFIAIDELRTLAAASGWELVDVVTEDGGHYLAELVLVAGG
ncbi:MAG: class I SAM-dependent methyltransferase [Acidimicrobiia bacterium]|nr:class I SAM-dependent methyltransferase [Acidimicrobiia bacterium]